MARLHFTVNGITKQEHIRRATLMHKIKVASLKISIALNVILSIALLWRTLHG